MIREMLKYMLANYMNGMSRDNSINQVIVSLKELIESKESCYVSNPSSGKRFNAIDKDDLLSELK